VSRGAVAAAKEEWEIMHRHHARSADRTSIADVQPLEARTLLASAITPLAISTTVSTLGNVLNISGTNGDDRIYVTNTSGGIRITTSAGWSTLYTGSIAQIRVDARAGNDRIEIGSNIGIETALYGMSGIDTLVGGSGADRLYGGDGRDYLYGMAGNDTLVTIGDGAVDRSYGGAGYDNFWCDAGSGELLVDLAGDESAGGAVHRVAAFMSTHVSGTGTTHTVSTRLVGASLADPTLASYASGYANFATRPLFSKYGPRPDDIYQGSLGDCYLLASLGSVAKAKPQVIRDRIVDLGDGTYAVQFTSGGSTTTYVRVDADLPVASWGLAYAGFGRQGSIWAAIVEKAYAFYRYNLGSYESLEGGFMGDVYGHMGLSNSSLFSATSGTTLLEQLESDLLAGRAVTFGTRPAVGGVPITGSHAYMVDAVIRDASGQVTHLRLRNPWGTDDAPGHGPSDGYITLTAAQAHSAFWFACSARP
jgi:hypothetical protein